MVRCVRFNSVMVITIFIYEFRFVSLILHKLTGFTFLRWNHIQVENHNTIIFCYHLYNTTKAFQQQQLTFFLWREDTRHQWTHSLITLSFFPSKICIHISQQQWRDSDIGEIFMVYFMAGSKHTRKTFVVAEQSESKITKPTTLRHKKPSTYCVLSIHTTVPLCSVELNKRLEGGRS